VEGTCVSDSAESAEPPAKLTRAIRRQEGRFVTGDAATITRRRRTPPLMRERDAAPRAVLTGS